MSTALFYAPPPFRSPPVSLEQAAIAFITRVSGLGLRDRILGYYDVLYFNSNFGEILLLFVPSPTLLLRCPFKSFLRATSWAWKVQAGSFLVGACLKG